MSAATDLTATQPILDYGDRGLLLQFNRVADVLAWTAALRRAALPGVLEVVPASRTVLVKLDDARHQGATRQRLRRLAAGPDTTHTAATDGGAGPQIDAGTEAVTEVVIEVAYDGPDLAEVADRTGLSTAQVVDAHTGRPWRVAFGGSTPGFAYLVGGDPRLAVPRRAEQRPEVAAGTVALAGEFSGIYPRRAPGGWQLIGHTDAVLWDLDRPEPALLTPPMRVRFRAV